MKKNSAVTVLPKLEDIEKELLKRECQKSLATFVKHAWHLVDPTPIIWNWHIDAICEHLQAVADGQITDLVINMPPGHAKSILVSGLYPAWRWTRDPSWRVITCSYDLRLAIRDSMKSRDLMRSDWYSNMFMKDWGFKKDQDVKGHYQNTAMGSRFCMSPTASTTGWRSEERICDDPHNAATPLTTTECENNRYWWDNGVASRLNPHDNLKSIIVAQRLHPLDLCGQVIERDGVVHLNLPTEYEVSHKCVTSIGWEDPRTEEGELLFPQVYNEEVIEWTKKSLRASGFASQHQQRPVIRGGNIIREDTVQYWTKMPKLEEFERIVHSWDCTFKDSDSADFVAGHVWGYITPNFYLLDRVHAKMGFPETLKAIKRMISKWPDVQRVLIEDKANGSAIIAMLQKEIPGLIEAVNPKASKDSRVAAIAYLFDDGNVYLPDPQQVKWSYEVLAELVAYPRAPNDDDVDATTQALLWMTTNIRRKFAFV